jgi:hypothetical protein
VWRVGRLEHAHDDELLVVDLAALGDEGRQGIALLTEERAEMRLEVGALRDLIAVERLVVIDAEQDPASEVFANEAAVAPKPGGPGGWRLRSTSRSSPSSMSCRSLSSSRSARAILRMLGSSMGWRG